MPSLRQIFLRSIAIVLIMGLVGCQTYPPSDINNLCVIFKEKRAWYKQAKAVEKRRGTPIPVMMAFIHQESSFKANARPGRIEILGVKLWRKSSSYGYSQAKDGTWDWYRDKANKPLARRNNFADALDFIGWYNSVSKRSAGTALTDAYNLYLAYHEGHGGFKRKNHNKKKWLLAVAKKVENRSKIYTQQLGSCKLR